MRVMPLLILTLAACRNDDAASDTSGPPSDTEEPSPDSAEPSITTALTGDTAVTPPTGDTANPTTAWVDDRLAAEPNPLQDVLFVIDNSGSMATYQDRTAEAFEVFLSTLAATGVDWHIGVTSTDVGTEDRACSSSNEPVGRLREVTPGGARWLDPTTASPLRGFANMAALGTLGSGCEKGLAAARITYDEPFNAGFFRAGASTHIVVVSDEQDQSEHWGPPTVTLADFNTWFGALNPEADRSFSGIICHTVGNSCGQDYVGTRYMEVQAVHGGVIGDISELDYEGSLASIAKVVTAPRATYALSTTPDAALVTVAIDRGGVLIPADAPYDAVTNTVRFADDERPLPGDVVVISYPPAP